MTHRIASHPRQSFAPGRGYGCQIRRTFPNRVTIRADERHARAFGEVLIYIPVVGRGGKVQIAGTPIRALLRRYGGVKKRGDTVSVGDLIGKIGNTGPSGWAHVHLQVQRGTEESNLIPIVLKNVRISLNGGGNDYWARNLEKWKIQEGYFIETTVPLSSR